MLASDIKMLLMQIQYPGMPALESNISRAWIRLHAYEYDLLEFNVRVGQGQEIQPGVTGATAQQFSNITRKRIDIAAHFGTLVDLVEVKPRASMGAIGQLLGYRHLWQEDFPLIAVRQLLVLAQVADSDVSRAAAAQGITVLQIEPEAHK
jgi:hypothetical protein